uniref:Conotoxin n=1 Tax=Conus andremenezi TaxID=1077466 RepID=A0A291C227_9COND|nr:conotoxin [Conus andremenezi]
MMLFMFAAIIFTMASTTVTAETCTSDKRVCAWQGQNDTCSCSNSNSCTRDDAHKVVVTMTQGGQSFFTCKKISDFSACDGSQSVMNSGMSQLNCRCSGDTYKIENGVVVCG